MTLQAALDIIETQKREGQTKRALANLQRLVVAAGDKTIEAVLDNDSITAKAAARFAVQAARELGVSA